MLPVILIVIAAIVTLVVLSAQLVWGVLLGLVASAALAALSLVGYRKVCAAKPTERVCPECGSKNVRLCEKGADPAAAKPGFWDITGAIGNVGYDQLAQCRKCGHAEPYVTPEALVMAREDCRKRLMFWAGVTAVCALFSLWMLLF
ncbi:MAG: hypothetical protein ACI4B2_10060 [Parafannyhessea sp.]|jgi:hypothetical protein|uniref:hypothetical protein n=1 Tax=Parafannyhessea sp. TaxID=2847324 RepID=UPI003F09729A